MKNSKNISKVFSVLESEYTLDILTHLIDGEKQYVFFKEKYGRKISFLIKNLVKCGLIHKRLDAAKTPIGYTITTKGRWISHACANFHKILVQAY